MPSMPSMPSMARLRVTGARRLAAAAAYGGGGITALGVAGVGLLAAEALMARRWILTRTPPAFDASGRFEPAAPAAAGDQAPLVFAMLGDSAAAGQGAASAAWTPGALLAQGLADLSGRAVDLHVVAVPGAVSEDLYAQLERLRDAGVRPDAACIVVGANDVTKRRSPEKGVRALSDAVSSLRAEGTEVVVGTCPDLGTVRQVAQPLRTLGRRWSRRLAAAQTIAVVMAGGRVVSIGDLLGPLFEADPDGMFAVDRFHPSSQAYARAAECILPSVAAALGILPVSWEAGDDGDPGWDVVPLPVDPLDLVAGVGEAAVFAADNPGTEVTATLIDGTGRGPRGRWVRLVRRRTRPRLRVGRTTTGIGPRPADPPVGRR